MDNQKIASELVDMAERIASTKTAAANRVQKEINSILEKEVGFTGTAKDVMTEKRISMWFRSQLEVNIYDKTSGKTIIEFQGQLYNSPKDVASSIIKTWKQRGDLDEQ